LCHTIVVDQKSKNYNAASPDELALVNFAKQKGYEFVDRDADDNCIIKCPNGDLEKYALLNICEFNSTRKRMSVVFRGPNEDNTITLMTKGADSIIYDILSKDSQKSEEYKKT